MDPWSINTASQTSWPPFLFCTHLFLIFWRFFFFSIVILNSLMYNLNPKQSITIVSTIPFLNIYFPDFLAIFLDFLKHFLWPRTLNTAHCSWFSEYKTKVISKCICICLFVLKTNAIAKLSSKAILLHPSNPCRLLMEKLME